MPILSPATAVVDTTSHARNNLDFFRFVLAAAVILSHSPQLIDGNAQREVLMQLTGNRLALGATAVNAFFVISGYLITQSWLRSASAGDYLLKRLLRIYPGYIAASLVLLLVVAPLTSGERLWWRSDWFRPLYEIAVLRYNGGSNTFPTLPYHGGNGAVWTIPYEFWCYIVLAFVLSILRHRLAILGLFALAYVGYQVKYFSGVRIEASLPLINELSEWPRFLAYYFSGACLFLYRDRVRYTRWLAILSAVLLVVCVTAGWAELALPIAGSYLLMYAAFLPMARLNQFGKHGDFSYGVYLYGWPMQQLVLLWIPGIGPWVHFVLSLIAASACAVASWHLVENPFLRRKPGSRRTTAAVAA